MAENYTITSQRETTIIGPDERFSTAVHVTFKTKQSGLTGSVDIPKNLYTADYVHSQVAEYANELEKVHGL